MKFLFSEILLLIKIYYTYNSSKSFGRIRISSPLKGEVAKIARWNLGKSLT